MNQVSHRWSSVDHGDPSAVIDIANASLGIRRKRIQTSGKRDFDDDAEQLPGRH
jgi:hypothetical protein